MNKADEGPAPWSRIQKQAAFWFPVMLIVGILAVVESFTGKIEWSELPAWGKLIEVVLVFAVVVLALSGIVASMFGERPDERDAQIALKAHQRAFVFLVVTLLIPFELRHMIWPGPPSWDPERLAVGLSFLAFAVYFGSVLQLYRSKSRA